MQIGKVLKPQGIKGEIKVLPLSNPDFFKEIEYVSINGTQAKIESASIREDGVYLKLDIIRDRNDAEEYRDAILSVEREALPDLEDGQFFYEDLIGCEVFFEDGERVGEIINIENYGSKDIFEIHHGFSNTLCPFVEDVFTNIDTKTKKIIANRKKYLEVTDYED